MTVVNGYTANGGDHAEFKIDSSLAYIERADDFEPDCADGNGSMLEQLCDIDLSGQHDVWDALECMPADAPQDKLYDDMIGIDEDRLHHMLGVARVTYGLCKRYQAVPGLSENDCRAMFVVGLLHDVGYEFSKSPLMHPTLGAKMLTDAAKYAPLVLNHSMKVGSEPAAVSTNRRAMLQYLLNCADLVISREGDMIDPAKRLSVAQTNADHGTVENDIAFDMFKSAAEELPEVFDDLDSRAQDEAQ